MNPAGGGVSMLHNRAPEGGGQSRVGDRGTRGGHTGVNRAEVNQAVHGGLLLRVELLGLRGAPEDEDVTAVAAHPDLTVLRHVVSTLFLSQEKVDGGRHTTLFWE